jgi:type II secretory pathway component PulJ
LIELLTAMALSGIVLVGLVSVFGAAVTQQLTDGQKREEFEASIGFEQRVRKLISHAYLSPVETDLNSFFIGRTVSGTSLGSNASDELVFTTVGLGIPGNATTSDEVDFDARNQTLGPVGGTVEVAITLTPIGQGGDGEGVYIREQRPADTDPDQGGFESVLDSGIESISFEFFDGTDWIGDWDTSVTRALPRAVRVSYTLVDESETVRMFVVRLANEAPAAPVEDGGEGGT